MTTREFLRELRGRDIRVWVEGDRMRVNAPQGALTPELQADLQMRKLEVLAFLRAASAPRSCIVPIQPQGSRTPFFAVPGHNGDVFCYVRLAHHLGMDQPFYAFEPPGIDGSCPPLTDMEALAARYVADLRAVRPSGPYLLGGYCVGGIVAFEVACQLRALGEEVAVLVLFDASPPSALRPLTAWRMYLRFRRDQMLQRLREVAQLPWREQLAFARERLARVAPRRRGTDVHDPAVERRQQLKNEVAEATMAAATAYARRPRVYPGPIVHFLSSEETRRLAYGRQLDWERYARDGVEIAVGPEGCQGDVMLREPHVRVFAELLRGRLDALAARTAGSRPGLPATDAMEPAARSRETAAGGASELGRRRR